jgi:hypothetical protein
MSAKSTVTCLRFAFERFFRQEDAFGKVRGDEPLWGREARRRWSV